MNDGKSHDEGQAMEFQSSADNQSVKPNEWQRPDLRRRRLIRGAMGAAPVVLTLRSGALAAASCVGGVLPQEVTLLTNGEIPTSAGNVDANSKCFLDVTACPNDQNKLGGGTPLSNPAVSPITPPGAEGGSGFKCEGGTVGQNVAILSGASYRSLTGGPV